MAERIGPASEEVETDGESAYIYESDQESEPYEYETPSEYERIYKTLEELSSEHPQTRPLDTAALQDEEPDPDYYIRFISSLEDSTDERIKSMYLSPEEIDSRSVDSLEYIAAKECQCLKGYNGHRISAVEMRACTTAQFLVPKQYLYGAEWNAEQDDEEFEGGEYFLSGLTDRVTTTNSRHSPHTWPKRHGVWRVGAANYLRNWSSAPQACMPFHPYCLEVYKRASLHRFGTLGIKALTDWYRLENNVRDFHLFPRHAAVWRGRGHTWQHHSGDEWLAANPCFIPKLLPLLDSFKCRELTIADNSGTIELNDSPRDIFICLPMELQFEILSYLRGSDIANLVQSSRTFWLLPPSFFYNLLMRETPWLWEAWCDLPYSFWATTTHAEQKAVSEYWKRQRCDLTDWRIPVLVEESQHYGMDDLGPAISHLRARGAAAQQAEARERRPRPAYLLPKTGVDWRGLFIVITLHLPKLNGLRNRARIWADCEYILDRIEVHQAEGRIGDGTKVDPVAIARHYFAENPDHHGPIYPH